MQLTALLSLLATVAVAMPATLAKRDVSMSADSVWTFRGVQRTCDIAFDSCTWNLEVDTGVARTQCAFSTLRTAATPTTQAMPAGQTLVNGAACPPFTVSTGWDGSFGPGNGFTTLSVVDYEARTIAYPAYRDVELGNGTAVTPERSYPVLILPS